MGAILFPPKQEASPTDPTHPKDTALTALDLGTQATGTVDPQLPTYRTYRTVYHTNSIDTVQYCTDEGDPTHRIWVNASLSGSAPSAHCAD